MTSGSAHLVSPPCRLENVSFPNGHWRLALRPPAEVKAGPGLRGQDCHSDLQSAPPPWPSLGQRLVLGKLTWRWACREAREDNGGAPEAPLLLTPLGDTKGCVE